MIKITSRDNNTIKLLTKLLSSSKERRESGLFVLEGERLVTDAIASGIEIHSIYATEDWLGKNRDRQTILNATGEIFVLEEHIFQKVSDTKTPQGIIALCKASKISTVLPENLKNGALLLCSLQDPGNVGTIIRTAEAFGLSAVAITSDCADITSPKVIRSSMGAVFRIAVVEFSTAKIAIENFRERGVVVCAATLKKDSVSVDNIDLKGCCVAIGNEGAGLLDEVIEQCQANIIIPISAQAESLNAAMAAGIFAWELKKAVER